MDHVATWAISLDLFEHEDSTLARVKVRTGANELIGEGRAHRNPGDPPVPEIGDELAVGRALIDLGSQLVDDAIRDIAVLMGESAGS